MKTRIISGLIAAVLVAIALFINSYFGLVTVLIVAALASLAVFEMLKNTGCIKNNVAVIVAVVYAFLSQLAYGIGFVNTQVLAVLYVVAVVIFTVFDHENFGDRQITMMIAMPIAISFAFACLTELINSSDGMGIFYFIMVFNYALVSDIFAYFVGSAVGKHKLAPAISPKKTIEGAIGGILGALIMTVPICLVCELIYKTDINLPALLIMSPFLSAFGMLGDLFASAIKRNYGIKDYGNIMPGHGGVLDRTDSVLLVAPTFALLISIIPVV